MSKVFLPEKDAELFIKNCISLMQYEHFICLSVKYKKDASSKATAKHLLYCNINGELIHQIDDKAHE